MLPRIFHQETTHHLIQRKDTKAEANSNVRQLRESLRKTGKADMATKLIENML